MYIVKLINAIFMIRLASCQMNIVESQCDLNPCLYYPHYCNAVGECSLNASSCTASCFCPSGYTGDRCQYLETPDNSTGNLDSICLTNPCTDLKYCLNNSTCVFDKLTCLATCKCRVGYTGSRCVHGILEATESFNTTSTTPSFNCIFDPCRSSAFRFCENNGTCFLDTATCLGQCTCLAGYSGNRCENKINGENTDSISNKVKSCTFNPCVGIGNFCLNNGTCSLDSSTCVASCTCYSRFYGNRCENDIANSSTTISIATQSSQTCTFNPCSLSTTYCENNGMCKLNTETCTAYCVCPYQYSGSRCKEKLGSESLTTVTTTKESRTCAFNPCSWSSKFCENNGTCKLNKDTCFAFCVCPDGYNGSRCAHRIGSEITTTISTTKASRICAFNPCLWSMTYCENNGTCKMNTATCIAYCLCPKGFGGSRCAVTDTSSFITTTIRSKTCAFDYCSWSVSFCANGGTCSMDTNTCMARCKCQPGVSGPRCRDQLTTESPKTIKTTEENSCQDKICKSTSPNFCLNGGMCMVNKTTCTKTCSCKEGYSGKKCEKGDNGDALELNNDYDVCRDDAKERTESERQCGSLTMFTCVYGVCKTALITTDFYTAYQHNCSCDPGAQGIRCEYKCCLECGPNGNCSISKPGNGNIPTGCGLNDVDCNAVCVCEEGFHGKRCEMKISDQNDEGLETVTQGSVSPAYNVCLDDALERTEEERRCTSNIICVHGVCRTKLTSNGRWTGYEYNCECDIGAQGTFCEHKCCLYCGPNGHCHTYRPVAGNVSINCDCDLNYEGEFCEIYVPPPVHIEYEEATWYLWVVGICVVTFILLMIFAVVAPYVMWKHRVILIMKIVHFFQAYEDDDEKQWDAFVSYKADEADERFVVKVLHQKLEKEMGFKLCLHFRDFVPGETISNNIINAVEGSRRTILILTPRYIQSEFTRFEYEKAQEEMLKRKHRIIPILLENITESQADMDKNLKAIIGSVTYLEWPGDASKEKQLERFWKRFHLSMPKKKIVESVQTAKSFESGQITSSNAKSNIYSNSCSYFKQSDFSESESQEVYSEIGPIDETISPVIRPLTEKEEFELENNSHKRSTFPDKNSHDTQGGLKNDFMLCLDDMKLNLKNEMKLKSIISKDLENDSQCGPEFIV